MSSSRCAFLAALGMVPLAVPARPAPQEPATSGLYRSLFERGLAELAAGASEDAANSFLAAGELAPDAPLWKAYLARAEGAEPASDPNRAPSQAGPWRPVPHLSSDASFDPTGERLIAGYDPATLWDARTGSRIAVVEHRSDASGWRWVFDETGRLLLGLSRPTSDLLASAGLDVRDARTGEPIVDHVLAISGVRWDTRFTWMPSGTRLDAEHRHSAFQVALPDGVLRWTMRSTRASESVDLSPDGRRAAYLFGGAGGVLRLVDTATSKDLATFRAAGWLTFFSDGGQYLASVTDDQILLIDAETGQQLAQPPAPERPGGRRWACCFANGMFILVDGRGRVVFWDPRRGKELRRFELIPPPVEDLSLVQMAAGGSRLLLNNYTKLRVYDSDTGCEVWSDAGGRYDFNGAVSADGLRITTGYGSGGRRILDVRTGATLTELSSLPFGSSRTELLAGGDACVVQVSDGTMRRIELATARTSALVAGGGQLRTLNEAQLLDWSNGDGICVRDPRTLQVLEAMELEPGEALIASAFDGSRVLTVHRELGVRVRALPPDPASAMVDIEPTSVLCATFSPAGLRLALVLPDRIRLVDAESGAMAFEFALQDTPNPRICRFYGEDRLALGWGDQDRAGVDVISLPAGERVARLGAAPCMMGGTICDLRCDPDIDRIVFSVSACGYVAAFREEDWSLAWSIDYGGGNPSQLSLVRAAGSKRLCVSGMSGTYARVVDIETGEVLAQDSVDGCYELGGSSGDRFICGAIRGGQVVFSGETFEPLYVRSEGAEGSAWIVRHGKELEVVGERGWETSARHLERGGLSHPADCWDACILDPLGLVRAPLDVLPEPPRILDGPPRVVLAEGDAEQLTLEVESADPLLGIQIEITGRATELASLDSALEDRPTRAALTVAGPWPVDLRLRAVARSGVLSSPWRVRIEPFR